MAIYTKRGDRGETSLFDEGYHPKIRVSKDSLRIRAIGAIDELNSFLGVVASDSSKTFKKKIENLQKDLFRIGSILASAKLYFASSKVKKLEKEIDKMENSLPPLKNFILPGGRSIGASLHYARTLARRAERELVALDQEEKVNVNALAFINRLSDYLFMLARKANFDEGFKETIWRAKKKSW